ncbi:MAG: hypothetical protein AAGI68_05065 [Planctomycetota bacterium]
MRSFQRQDAKTPRRQGRASVCLVSRETMADRSHCFAVLSGFFFLASWRLGVLAIFTLGLTAPVQAQLLQGAWVDAAQERIERHRMTDLRVIVLDAAGDPVEGATVRIEQVAHDFEVGCTFDDRVVMGMDLGDPVLGVFNAISLAPLTGWAVMESAVDDVRGLDRLDAVLSGVATTGRTIRWGPVLSADPAANPDWLAGQDAKAVEASVREHVGVVMTVFGKRIDGFDLYADALSHSMMQDRLGLAGVRRLFQQARFLAPGVPMSLRVRGGLSPGREGRLFETVAGLNQLVVPFDGLTIEQRFEGRVEPLRLERSLDRAGALGKPITLAELEVGGPTPVAAAINLETVLRLAFAEPSVAGVYMKSVRPSEGLARHAELIGADAEPTPSGKALEGLFRGLWWTDTVGTGDELGNVYRRVFAGRYRLSVLEGEGAGVSYSVLVHVPKSAEERVVVLQPLKR